MSRPYKKHLCSSVYYFVIHIILYKHTTPIITTSQVDREILDNCPLSAMCIVVGKAILPHNFFKTAQRHRESYSWSKTKLCQTGPTCHEEKTNTRAVEHRQYQTIAPLTNLCHSSVRGTLLMILSNFSCAHQSNVARALSRSTSIHWVLPTYIHKYFSVHQYHANSRKNKAK
jgi:hypothetical protein